MRRPSEDPQGGLHRWGKGAQHVTGAVLTAKPRGNRVLLLQLFRNDGNFLCAFGKFNPVTGSNQVRGDYSPRRDINPPLERLSPVP